MYDDLAPSGGGLAAFLAALRGASHEADFHKVLEAGAAGLGFNRFAYVRLPRATEPAVGISNYPQAWADHYTEARLYESDPVVARALSSAAPFAWGSSAPAQEATAAGERIMTDAAKFGITDGYTIPIHDAGGFRASLTFLSGDGADRFRARLRTSEPIMQLMGAYLHAAVEDRLIARADLLSVRELECLRCSGEGLGPVEVAQSTGFSVHEVRTLLANARRKLGVRTTHKAIAKAVMCGQLALASEQWAQTAA